MTRNLIAELSLDPGPSSLVLVRNYTWGLDVSGSFQGAGGVGGLLSLDDAESGATQFMSYDGNGNVIGLVNAANATCSARYEYSALGETVIKDGTGVAAQNPFRFSTKYTDDETALVYYGYRYYGSNLGRWLSRDPLQEAGSTNSYGFVSNSPANLFDVLGLFESPGHGFTSFYVYRQGNWGHDEAFAVAYYSQLPDLLPQFDAYSLYKATQLPHLFPGLRAQILNYIGPDRDINVWGERMYNFIHSLHGGGDSEVWRRRNCLADLLRSGQLLPWQQGFLTHAFGDTYPHAYGAPGDEHAYGPFPNGHNEGSIIDALTGYGGPDSIAHDQAKYERYVRALHGTIQRPGRSGYMPIEWALETIRSQIPWRSEVQPYYMHNFVNSLYGYRSPYMMDVPLENRFRTPSAQEVDDLVETVKKHCCLSK